jgi:hypothetical protein
MRCQNDSVALGYPAGGALALAAGDLGDGTGYRDTQMSVLGSLLFALTGLSLVAIAVLVVAAGALDHQSKHSFEARCQHHDGVVIQFANGSKTCLPKDMEEALTKLNGPDRREQ